MDSSAPGFAARAGLIVVELAEWAGCAFGLLGALLLATNTRASSLGFAAFLASNIAWIGYALARDVDGLLLQQAGFTLTSLLGLYRWRGSVSPRRNTQSETENGYDRRC